jgi:membrane protease YdiL (CAAX protease family)
MNQVSLSWNAAYGSVVVALATFTLGYFLYWFIANSSALRNFCHRRYQGQRAQAMYILFQRIVGIVFLGGPAVLLTIVLREFRFEDFGVTRIESISTLYWILGICAVIVPLVLSFSRTPSFFQTYPLIREQTWDVFLVVANTSSWCLYILIYEFLFRGFLLGACVGPFGVWPAILVNVAVYVCVHIPYGFWVTLGSLPLGLAMCMATVQTGNIWTAYVAHLLVALLNDYVALAANPATRVRLR